MDLQMNHHLNLRTNEGTWGFSLVEMLVALVFTAFLMSGMAKVFQASVRNYNAVNETIAAQRTNRWALDQVSDDISQAGLVFPDRVLPTMVTAGSESLFSITPPVAAGLVVKRISDTNPALTENETIFADTLQFFTDVPLPVSGTWKTATDGETLKADGTSTSAPTKAEITFTLGTEADLRSGDVMVILDSGELGSWEHPLIEGPANPVVFLTDATKIAQYTATLISPGITLAHPADVPVYFIRPAQLVNYSVQAVALDPAHPDVTLPCLVRQQTNYPTSGTVDWTKVATQIIAENVEGFRVDLSFDGGATWARPTTANPTWADITANANAKLATIGLPGLTSITDPANRDWFRTINCLIRVDITTRAPVRREEFSPTAGVRAYRTRTQTLMISPRNFGVGK